VNRHLVIVAAIQLVLVPTVATAQTPTISSSIPANGCLSNGRPTLVRRQSVRGSNGVQETSTQIPPCPTSNPQIKFHGLTAISEATALFLFREKQILSGDRRPEESAKAGASALTESLVAEGYANAEVQGFADQKGTFSFFVNEGPRVPLTEVRFEGNRVFSTGELVSFVNGCLSRVERPISYQKDKLEWCERTVLNHIRSSGYLEAKLRNTVEITKRGYVVSFELDEGTLYRLGKIKIAGAKVFPEEQIRAQLSLREGEIAKGDSISKWLFEDLKSMYGEFGYIEYTAEVSPTFKREQGLVDLQIEIEEGRQFSLRSITFEGGLTKGMNLINRLPLKPGDIYSERLFRDSVARLNDTGFFEPVDADKDVQMTTDSEEALVQVVIKLKKRE
jgi:outer membrane protein insertion porin family